MIELAAESTRDPEIARAVQTKDRAFEPNITALCDELRPVEASS